MKIRAVKAIGDDAELLGTRLVAASAALSQLTAEPQDAFKRLDLDIEYEDGGQVKLDIEYADGGRVNVEGRA